MTDPIRLGLIGLGGWGRRIAATIADLPGCVLAGVASRSPDAGDHVPRGMPVVADWRDLLASGHIQGVVIATPPTVRGEIAGACIAKGLPVYLEKPIALNGRAAGALARSAEKAGTLLTAGHLHLYAPAFRAIHDGVKKAGGARRITSAGGNNGPFRSDYRALLDYGPHDVSMALAVTGEPPRRVHASRTRGGDDGRSEVIEAELTFRDCTAVMSVGNLMDEKQRSFRVETQDGAFVYDDMANDKAVHVLKDGMADPLSVEPQMPLAASLARFGGLVRDGRTKDPDFAQAITVMQVLDAIALSVETGTPVLFEHDTALTV